MTAAESDAPAGALNRPLRLLRAHSALNVTGGSVCIPTCLVSYSTKAYPLMQPVLRSIGMFTASPACERQEKCGAAWAGGYGSTSFDGAVFSKLVEHVVFLHKL